MLKLLSLITGRKLVLLLHYSGELTKTIESKNPNPFTATNFCYIYWGTKVGLVNLHKDGTTTGRSYIKKWVYV